MQKPRKKALLVTRNLPPLVGGMERLVLHVAEALRREYQVHVIGPVGCAKHLPHDVTTTEIPVHPLPWFLIRACCASVWQGLRYRPDLGFAGSGLTAPFAWLASRLIGVRCAVYLHGLDIEARNPVYRSIWPLFLRRCDLVFVNSRFSQGLAEVIGINPSRIHVLHPGVALPDQSVAAQKRQAFRKRYVLGNAPVMLYVGRITVRKGLAVFVRDILPLILRERPDARLVVVGDEARQALLQNPGEAERVRGLLDERNLAHAVLFLGQKAQDDPELEEAYFAADVNVFPVQQRKHDNEGFGMVAVEAAAHGLPTVAFAVGGVPEAVQDGVSGRLVKAGDNQGFARAVLEFLHAPNEFFASQARDFAQRFAWDAFGRQMLEKL
ncbi:glycosyltransferase family 4 protein [Desulfonatronum parangueonense]